MEIPSFNSPSAIAITNIGSLSLAMRHTAHYLSGLVIIPALLLGNLSHPVQAGDSMNVAQLLDAETPQVRNSEVAVQNFLTLLSQQKYQEAAQYMSPSIQGANSAAQLQELWQKLIKTTGPLLQIVSVNGAELLGNYSALATIRFRDTTEDLTFKLDQNQKIIEVNFLWLGSMQADAERFVTALAKGEYVVARSYLQPSLKNKLLPEVINQRWMSLLSKTGAFKKIKSSTLIQGGTYDVVQLDLEFEKYSGKFYVFFNPLSQIVGLSSPLNKR